MRPLRWDSSYSVFLPQVDAEHRSLFRLANELQTAVLSMAPQARLQETVQALASHIEEHFSYEERLMRSSGYETLTWHKAQHDGIRRRISRARKQAAKADREALLGFIEHITGWLRDHTGLTDRMMSAYLRNYERQQQLQVSRA